MKTFFALLILFFITSCSKNKPSCYSRSLERNATKSPCLSDCPGVIGCDGKFYCNECDANSHGIKIR